MTAPEPTPLEAAGFAWWSVHMHVGTWADESPQNRAYYAEQAAKIVAPALAGDWLERVLGEHSDFTYIDTPADPAHFVCDCGHAFGYEDGAHAEWEAHLAAAIRTAAGVGL